MKQHQSASRCCSCSELLGILYTVTGFLCIGAALVNYFVDDDEELTDMRHQYLLYGLMIGGGVLCLLHAIPCWRRWLTFGLLYGYAGVLGGLRLGYCFIVHWNESASAYVASQHGGGIEGSSTGATEYLPTQSLDQLVNPTTVSLMGYVAAALGALALVDGFLTPRWLTQGQRLCGQLLFCVIAGTTIMFCSGSALFMQCPGVETHGYFFGRLIEAPPHSGFYHAVLLGLMIAGGSHTWCSMIGRRGRYPSCCGTLLFVLVILAHVAAALLGFVDLELPSAWGIYPQPIVWAMFAVSGSLLFLTLCFRCCVRSMKSKEMMSPPLLYTDNGFKFQQSGGSTATPFPGYAYHRPVATAAYTLPPVCVPTCPHPVEAAIVPQPALYAPAAPYAVAYTARPTAFC